MKLITPDQVTPESVSQVEKSAQRLESDIAAFEATDPVDVNGNTLRTGDNVMVVNGAQEGRQAMFYQVLSHAESTQYYIENGFPNMARHGLAEKVRSALFWVEESAEGDRGFGIFQCDDVALIKDDSEDNY